VLIGAKLPNTGPLPLERGIHNLARELEEAGADSIWVSDHVVQPARITSRYPFAADGLATWSTETPYIEAMVALALAAAATERVRLGTAVLVLPLRNPVMFAKQAASIDVASRGRLELGLGAGWLEEEFAALNAPFRRRGRQLTEWIEIARECWSGTPSAHSSEDYTLPADTLCLPVPAHPIPILLGGHSPGAIARAARIADGWLGQQPAGELDADAIAEVRASLVRAALESGRGEVEPRIVLRIVESAGSLNLVAEALNSLTEAGVSEVIIDLTWDSEDQAAQIALLRTADAAPAR
jgi:probable F420-dependent oxidoreductase